MALYIITHSSFHHPNILSVFSLLSPDCMILLCENGVYNGLPASPFCQFFCENTPKAQISILEADCRARGILQNRHPAFRLIHDDGLVALTEICHPIISWS